MINLHTKFEVSMLTRCEKALKCGNLGGMGWSGFTQGHRQPDHSIECIQLPI